MNTQELEALAGLMEGAYEAERKAAVALNKEQPAKHQNEAIKMKKQVEQTLGANFRAPKYDIIYKQQVTAEEVYGGFAQMTPSCADSQFLVVKIQLPGELFSNLDLNITRSTLTLFGKQHRLHLELPNDVDEKTAKAQFRNGTLEVQLRRVDNLS